jgi:hypothetical protein
LGINPEAVFNEVVTRIRQAGDSPRASKINSQLERAYAYAKANRAEFVFRTVAAPEPVFDSLAAEKFAGQIPELPLDWLLAFSQPVGDDPADFLAPLYRLGEQVLVFDDWRGQGQALWQHGMSLNHFRHNRPNVWFLAQPVDGQAHFNPRQMRWSRRSEESVTSWRYAVLECDLKPEEKWMPVWWRVLLQLPLPIVALYTSGGRSIHALVWVGARSKAEWDRRIRGTLKSKVVPLGADPGTFTAVRLTRLPGCWRGERGAYQRLLYFEPQNRSHESLWSRYHERK